MDFNAVCAYQLQEYVSEAMEIISVVEAVEEGQKSERKQMYLPTSYVDQFVRIFFLKFCLDNFLSQTMYT